MSGPGAANGPLIIRADASTTIGTGHVMRCLALAQAWQDAGGTVIFMMATAAAALASRLQAEGMGVTLLPGLAGSAADAGQTAALARRHEAAWVVVDGYQFGADYQRLLKDSGVRLLFFDDGGHAAHYCADIVLNQNLHAHEDLYRLRDSGTQLLLGPRYVLLRREFLSWRGWKRAAPETAQKVLVTLGGADRQNFSEKVLLALQSLARPDLQVQLIIGAANPHFDRLNQLINQTKFPVKLLQDVSDIPKFMAWADMAISSGGSTVWELAFMGVSTLVGKTVPIEDFTAQGLNKYRLFVDIGWFQEISLDQLSDKIKRMIQDKEMRESMGALGQQIVDGFGGDRVVKAIQDKSHG